MRKPTPVTTSAMSEDRRSISSPAVTVSVPTDIHENNGAVRPPALTAGWRDAATEATNARATVPLAKIPITRRGSLPPTTPRINQPARGKTMINARSIR